MPVYNYPYIRDTLIINDDMVKKFYNNFSGPDPVFLIGRIVQHAPGYELVLGSRPLIIVADLYDGNGGMIDARGDDGKAGGYQDNPHGTSPWPQYDSRGWPVGPGGNGKPGTPGSLGTPGGNVTVLCRRSVNAKISVAGGGGGAGGPGGNGGPGINGFFTPEGTEVVDRDPFDENPGDTIIIPEKDVPGTPGGYGGGGGFGGAGGNGGSIRFISIADETYPVLDVAGGRGGPPGPAGLPGPPGSRYYPPEIEYYPPESEVVPDYGGAAGLDGQLSYTNIPEDQYLPTLLAELAPYNYANYWAPFRIVTGDYFYHRHNPSIPVDPIWTELAAIEFERALELQPDNVEAIRLQRQLVGFPEPVPGSDEIVWKGGGNNALGLPYDLDVLPQFDQYIQAYTSFGALALEFLDMATGAILTVAQMDQLGALVVLQLQQARSARDNISDNVQIAVAEQSYANDEAAYAQKQLDQASRDIQAAYEEMQQQRFSHDSVLGTLFSIGAAVVGIVAALPSGGASLVALVPSMIALSDSLYSNADPIVKALFKGKPADTKAVEDAYKNVNKNVTAVIGATKSIVNFVDLVEKLNAGSTPDNAKYVALVRRGVELTHEVLQAGHRATIAGQRVEAAKAQLGRAEGAVAAADALKDSIKSEADALKAAGLLALQTAQARMDALLSLAFRAQRSVEIYTLQDQGRHLFLDAGLISPDEARAYYEEEFKEGRLVALLQESWAKMMAPLDIQSDYISFFAQFHDQDTYRILFGEGPEMDALKREHRFTFRVDVSDLPQDHFDTKVKSVRLAFVGASHPSGEISCEVRHGGRYEQRRRGGTIAIQELEPRLSTRPAKTTRLLPDEGLGFDPPLTAPRSLAFWGRGIGGDWELTIPESQFASGNLDLSGVTEIQVWIGYQFIR